MVDNYYRLLKQQYDEKGSSCLTLKLTKINSLLIHKTKCPSIGDTMADIFQPMNFHQDLTKMENNSNDVLYQ